MRHGGVKLFSDYFRRRSKSEEKTPFASTFTDHGSIDKDSKMARPEEDSMLSYGNSSTEKTTKPSIEEFADKPKLTLLRKLCILLSLNTWVAYFAVLLWVVPCRHPLCFQSQEDWQMNLTALLTTNMETTKVSGSPFSVVFGYSDESGGHLASLAISDGKTMWNHSSEHFLRHVFCQFDSPLELNGIRVCIATAYSFIGAFDASNGQMIWKSNVSIPDGETIHRISLARGPHDTTYILGTSDAYLFVLNAENGVEVSTITLPCSWTIDIKLVGPWTANNGTIWTLVCEYGDSVEVWTFQEGELLKPPQKSAGKNLTGDVGFSLLFSRESSSGSIDLAGDVTTTPDSLALSWADIVVMVTAQAPFHHLQKTWERRFSGPLGESLPVTSIVFGSFTDPKKNEIAVTLQEGSNMTIHILETKNGTTVAATELGMGSVMAMGRIPGGKDKTDTIVIESILHSARKVNSSRQPSDPTTRSYFTLRYIGNSMTYQTLMSSEVYASTLSLFSEGVADLLTASKAPGDQTSITRLVINTAPQGPFCNSNNHRNTTTVLLLD